MTDTASVEDQGPAAPSIDDIQAEADPALTTDPPPSAPTSPVGLQPYSLDETRKRIAYLLLFIMIGIILVVVLVSLMFSVDCWLHDGRCQPAQNALTMLTGSISPLFTAMVGLVGSVVGFYFGSKQTESGG